MKFDERQQYSWLDPSRIEFKENGSDADWLGTTDGILFEEDIYSPSHVYRLYWTGTDLAVTFQIFDAIYSDNFGSLQVEITQAPVPEPSTIFLIGTGLIGVAGYRKRKAKK